LLRSLVSAVLIGSGLLTFTVVGLGTGLATLPGLLAVVAGLSLTRTPTENGRMHRRGSPEPGRPCESCPTKLFSLHARGSHQVHRRDGFDTHRLRTAWSRPPPGAVARTR